MNKQNKRKYELENTGGNNPEDTVYPQDNGPRKKIGPKKKRRKKYYILKFCIFILACIGVYFFLHSGIFNIDVIKVTGNVHFKVEEVEKITGVKRDVNMFEIRTGEMEDKLLDEAYVQEVKISRDLPKTIKIDINERTPLTAIKQSSEYVILDEEGIVLETVAKPPKLTLLMGFHVKKAEEKGTLKVKEPKSMEKVLAVLKSMDQSNMKFKQAQISGSIVKICVKSKLWCTGNYNNIIENIDNGHLKSVLDDLKKKGKNKGMIYIGDNQYISFRSKIK